jgi:hypothetical protein
VVVVVFSLIALVLLIGGIWIWRKNKRQHQDHKLREVLQTLFGPVDPVTDGGGPQPTIPGKPPVPQPDAPPAPPLIFVSYRRMDSSDVAGRIYDRLVGHFGQDAVFKDVDSIPLGVDFREHLSNSVGQCDVLLAVIGRQWLTGEAGRRDPDDTRDYVRIEVEAALQRGIPVIPVLVQGAAIPADGELPQSLQTLAYRNGISVRADPDFHQDMERLIKGIEAHTKGKARG